MIYYQWFIVMLEVKNIVLVRAFEYHFLLNRKQQKAVDAWAADLANKIHDWSLDVIDNSYIQIDFEALVEHINEWSEKECEKLPQLFGNKKKK